MGSDMCTEIIIIVLSSPDQLLALLLLETDTAGPSS